MSTHKFKDFGHLDLRENSTGLVISEAGSVANGEGVWALDADLAWLATVEFCHALNLGKSNKIAIFQAMSSLVKACHKAISVLKDELGTRCW